MLYFPCFGKFRPSLALMWVIHVQPLLTYMCQHAETCSPLRAVYPQVASLRSRMHSSPLCLRNGAGHALTPSPPALLIYLNPLFSALSRCRLFCSSYKYLILKSAASPAAPSTVNPTGPVLLRCRI